MQFLQACFICVAVLPACGAAAQTTWTVSNDPAENADFPTLLAAVASPTVRPGDTLELSEGLGPYFGEVPLDRPLRIIAEAGESPIVRPPVTPISPRIAIRASMTAAGSEIEGLVFEGDGTDWGVRALGVLPFVLRDCVFRNLSIGTTSSGLKSRCTFVDCGLGANGGTIEDCVFLSTLPPPTGVRTFVGLAEVRRSLFTGPAQVSDAGEGATPRFISCRFENIGVPTGLSAFQGGVLNSDFSFDSCLFLNVNTTGAPLIDHDDIAGIATTLRNCTIVDCSAPALVEMRNSPGSLTLENSIIRGNNFATVFIGPVAAQSNITDFPLPGTNNIQTDPLFADAANGDYSLKRGSPAIDAGNTPLVPLNVTHDAAGNPRRVDDPIMPDTGVGSPPIVDIGAFEFQPPAPGFCQADLTTGAIAGLPGYGIPNGIVNNDDFFYYLTLFSGELGCGVGPGFTRCPSPPDLTTTAIPATPGYGILDGFISNDDFFYYLTLFAQGC